MHHGPHSAWRVLISKMGSQFYSGNWWQSNMFQLYHYKLKNSRLKQTKTSTQPRGSPTNGEQPRNPNGSIRQGTWFYRDVDWHNQTTLLHKRYVEGGNFIGSWSPSFGNSGVGVKRGLSSCWIPLANRFIPRWVANVFGLMGEGINHDNHQHYHHQPSVNHHHKSSASWLTSLNFWFSITHDSPSTIHHPSTVMVKLWKPWFTMVHHG